MSIKGYKEMNQDEKDSAVYFGSKFIQYIRDSIYLSVFTAELKNELSGYGFMVFTESDLDTFLTLKGPAYVFSVAQQEVEESLEPVIEEDVFDDSLSYYKKFNLSIVRLNTWFELSKLNDDSVKPIVLFSSFYVEDQLKGRFWRHPLQLDVKYRYLLNEVKLEDVFGLAGYAGKKNASYLFDYLFNLQLGQENNKGTSRQRYWHYNKLRNELRDAGENKFTVLDDKEIH